MEDPKWSMIFELVDLGSGKKIQMTKTPGVFNNISVTPDCKQLLAQMGERFGVWDLPTLKRMPDITGDEALRRLNIGDKFVNNTRGRPQNTEVVRAFDPLRNWTVAEETAHRLMVRNRATNEVIWGFAHPGEVASLAFVPRDGAILAGDRNGKIRRFVVPNEAASKSGTNASGTSAPVSR